MLTINTLSQCSFEEIVDAFNLAFSDYVVPVSLTKEQFVDKMRSDRIRLDLSVGAFEDQQLIGFILHGYTEQNNQKIAYNAGTGVIPTKRGQKLTATMYEVVFPLLLEQQIHQIVLEVITTNAIAIKTYQHLGFTTRRTLHCFKGSIQPTSGYSSCEIRAIQSLDWPSFQKCWDIQPSWQNAIQAMENLGELLVAYGAYQEQQLLGYILFNRKTHRIHQLAVAPKFRNQGIARKLLEVVVESFGQEVTAINIDETSEASIQFLQNVGLTPFVSQYEMYLMLS